MGQIIENSLDWKIIKEILIKNWMTHDAMWFFHCVSNCGIKNTNKINKAAVKSMAKIEIKRIKKLFGFNKIQNFTQFQELVKGIFTIVKADFMDFSFEYPEFNKFKFTMNKCFAYDGIKRIGYIKEYECGIFERLKGWFDELGINYQMSPKVKGCMMNECANCYRLFEFNFTE
ncbi:MAG: DUF6125 family protein [Candidatus Thorarchaeota archaeon]